VTVFTRRPLRKIVTRLTVPRIVLRTRTVSGATRGAGWRAA
jgi:hypothetical protein